MEEQMEKLEGKVAMYQADRGFGFLVTGGGQTFEKFFFHISEVVTGEGWIAVGAPASFSIHPVQQGKLRTATAIEITGGAL
jgi:cold shock CspA family protein